MKAYITNLEGLSVIDELSIDSHIEEVDGVRFHRFTTKTNYTVTAIEVGPERFLLIAGGVDIEELTASDLEAMSKISIFPTGRTGKASVTEANDDTEDDEDIAQMLAELDAA